ncbi:hypothetical protein [Sulfurimonas marina]|uniref:Glycosyl hydrolase family 32 N-terminal domain-containing protein n=1 Tax=Sulfurimonas marina TaxID=2590551 RepID=A0A7M1ATT0_9BACT|nr:hypothetical protein [Sulfurimonas marina]QOP40819.1 hypothetical protein FJR03_03315 [Sulfurimonas marina]
MNWKKLGQIFICSPIDEYLISHASNPLAVHLQDDIYRIFFSGRDKNNKSSVGYVDIDIIKQLVICMCEKVVVKYGKEDSFYSHGISIGNMYKVDNKNYIQFMAWQIRNGGHWRGDIGRLEVSEDFTSLELNPNNVYIGCNNEDPISLSYSWIMQDEEIYKMWYGSTIDWSSENGEMIHVIKYATSKDGEKWERHGLAIPYELGVAQAFSRPTVIKDKEGYHMWFSYRSGNGIKYRIGYAHSNDGLRWDRKQNSGIDVSENGWDSEMICYPFVFDHKDKRYMLYNGNDYGKTGFGLAVLEDE